MARYQNSMTVGLAVAQWPAPIRQRWLTATAEGDELFDGGVASHWSAKTHRTNARAFGQFIRFMMEHHLLQGEDLCPNCLNEPALRPFVEQLRCRITPTSVLSVLRRISAVLRLLYPHLDRSLLKFAISRLDHTVKENGKALSLLPTPDELLCLGFDLMRGWQARAAHDRRINAADYRNGLMIAFLALCPIRLGNLAQMQIGRHIDLASYPVRISFEDFEVKGRRMLVFDWPEELGDELSFYLSKVRPILARHQCVIRAMWPSLHNRPMNESGIYTAITKVTSGRLGYAVTPHEFRGAAATFISEMRPESAQLAAGVLQHASFETTRAHYIRGQQHHAARRYQDLINDIVRAASEGDCRYCHIKSD